MRLQGTPEIELIKVIVEIPGRPPFYFLIRIEPKAVAESVSGIKIPNVMLDVDTFRTIIKQDPRSFLENTEFVRYLIEGLSVINRRWPVYRNPVFYSNLSVLEKNGVSIEEFSFPTDDELARF